MGSNKTFRQRHGDRVMLGESAQFRRLRHAIEKAAGDRERAIRNVCRLYGVKTLDALPPGIRATALGPARVRKKMIPVTRIRVVCSAIAGAFQRESRLLCCGALPATERSEPQVALQSPGVKQ
jgi:hypothetical protein